MNTTAQTTRLALSAITQPKLKVDNLKHIHDHGSLVEFTEPKIVALMEQVNAARDGKLVLRAGESELTLEKVGRVLFTTLYMAVGSTTTRNVHYVSNDSPGGVRLRYTYRDKMNDSDEYRVLRATILGEKLPNIMRPKTGEAQDIARKFIKANRWCFLGEKGLHVKALENARKDAQRLVDSAKYARGEAISAKRSSESMDHAHEIECAKGRIKSAVDKRNNKRAEVANWLATLRTLDVTTLPETTIAERYNALAKTADQWREFYAQRGEDVPSSLASYMRNTPIIDAADFAPLRAEMASDDELIRKMRGGQLAWHVFNTRHINTRTYQYSHNIGADVRIEHSCYDTPVLRGRAEGWSHTEQVANYTATLDGDAIMLSSGVRCPFPASQLLAFLRGERSTINTQYGQIQRIETREGEQAKVLVKCGCHYVDVSTLSHEFAEACKPTHVVTKTEAVPELPLIRENWQAILERCEAVATASLATLEDSTRESIATAKQEIAKSREALAKRDEVLAKHDAAIEAAEQAVEDAEMEAQRLLADLSYEWRDESAVTSYVDTLFSVFESIRFNA